MLIVNNYLLTCNYYFVKNSIMVGRQQSKSYLLVGVMISAQVAAFFCQFYLIFIAICIKQIMMLINYKRQVQLRQFDQTLSNYPWAKNHRLIKDSLQYMKCALMIQRGYDSKSNTNLILQDEKQPNYPQEADLIHIGQPILNLLANLKKIKSLKDSILSQESQEKEEENLMQIKGFKSIFDINKQMDMLLQELSYLPNQIKQKSMKYQRFGKLVNLDGLQQRKKIRQLLLQSNVWIDRLSVLLSSQQAKINISHNFAQYLSILTTKQAAVSIEPVKKLIKQSQDLISQFNIDKRIPIPKLEPQEQTTQLAQIKEQPNDRPSFGEKKEFMKKLDSLLMIGFVKKQQQLFQQHIRQLQQQELESPQ